MRNYEEKDQTLSGNRPIPIILVNWNGWRDTIDCIRSCLALSGPASRIVVCDNASSDGSIEHISAWAKGDLEVPCDPASPIKLDPELLPNGCVLLDRAEAESGIDRDNAELVLIQTGANLGFAGGNNVGLRWALETGCQFAWLLNNDTVVPSDSLSQLTQRMSDDRNLGLCGSTMLEFHSPDTLQGRCGAVNVHNFRGRHIAAGGYFADCMEHPLGQLLGTHEIIYPIGASMMVSRAFLKEVGLMEEGYFLYFEEADWAMRARGKFGVDLAPQSLVYHKVGASAGSSPDAGNSRSAGFLFRSRLLITRKFNPGAIPVVAADIAWQGVKGILKGKWGRAKGALKALTGNVRTPLQQSPSPPRNAPVS